ncbi:MAG: hypothetical protein DCC65_01045 [Planctomycetota bacterium]|nr:MAG: hypothetical protein DCC65_01045 [Planctomycetota bacterium]
MRIESGPTGERKVRTTLMLLMVAVFAVWFAYDGLVGYPAKNAREYRDQLAPEERETAGVLPILRGVTAESWEALKPSVKSASPTERRALIEKAFGGKPSYENKEALFYFGPAYQVKFTVRDGNPVDPMIGAAPTTSATSIATQKYIAVGLAVLAVYLLRFVMKVRNTRLVLDEAGLVYNGRGPIPWAAMKRLDSTRFNDKGWVDLYYDEGGAERALRLDEYHLALFDDIIDEICARKGFENPLPVGEPPAQTEKA